MLVARRSLLTLSFALLVLLGIGTVPQPTHAAAVEVFPDILDDNELDMFSRVKVAGVSSEKSLGIAKLSKIVADRIHTVTGRHDASRDDSLRSRVVPITLVRKTTAVHRDHRWNDDGTPGEVVNDKAAFIFLNTNKDAFFVHGDDTIAAEAGKLLVFDGRIPHNSLIRKGDMRIAGPFQLETFNMVGTLDECLDDGGYPDDKRCPKGEECVCDLTPAEDDATRRLYELDDDDNYEHDYDHEDRPLIQSVSNFVQNLRRANKDALEEEEEERQNVQQNKNVQRRAKSPKSAKAFCDGIGECKPKPAKSSKRARYM